MWIYESGEFLGYSFISPLSAVEAGAHVSRDWDLIHPGSPHVCESVAIGHLSRERDWDLIHPGSAHAMVELVHVRLLVERAKRARENARDLLPGTSPCYLP